MKNIKLFGAFVSESRVNEAMDLSRLKPVELEGYKFEWTSGDSDEESLSDCCGAAPRGNGDSDSSDFGICPDCGDHCEYIECGTTNIVGNLSQGGKALGKMTVEDLTGGEDAGTTFKVDYSPVSDRETLQKLAEKVAKDDQKWTTK